jgi:translation initiation factor 2 subunit 3
LHLSIPSHCESIQHIHEKMPADEKFKNIDSESESESDGEEEIDVIPNIEVDPSKLTPLSPEVISKQVR